MNKLDKFRSRWFRWLGQKTRWDKPYWVTLLDSNWEGWASRVIRKHNVGKPILSLHSTREEVKSYYTEAIKHANMQELMGLDGLYCIDMIKKRGW